MSKVYANTIWILLCSVCLLNSLSAQCDTWARQGTAPNYGFTWDMAIDGNENLYISGAYDSIIDFSGMGHSSSLNRAMFLNKYDPMGNLIWSNGYEFQAAPWGPFAAGSSDAVYLYASFNQFAIFDTDTLETNTASAFLTKLDTNGTIDWIRQYESTDAVQAHSICDDGIGNLIIAGKFTGTLDLRDTLLNSANSNLFLAKVDPSGNPVWALQSDQMEFWHRGWTSTVGPNQEVFLGGSFWDSLSFGGINLADTLVMGDSWEQSGFAVLLLRCLCAGGYAGSVWRRLPPFSFSESGELDGTSEWKLYARFRGDNSHC